MADEKRIFTTLPTALLRDPRPSALDIRCLAAIAKRDGMTSIKGTGAGCYASFATLAADVDSNISNLSKSISRLVRWGYLAREKQEGDGRKSTLRVLYPASEKVVEIDKEMVGEPDNQLTEMVGSRDQLSAGNNCETSEHYIPLRGELDFVETSKLGSPKVRTSHSAKCVASDVSSENVIGFPGKTGPQTVTHAELQDLVRKAVKNVGTGRELARQIGVHEATVSMARRGRQVSNSDKFWALYDGIVDRGLHRDADPVSLFSRLPETFFGLDGSAQVPILERTLKTVKWADVHPMERSTIEGLLFAIADAFCNQATGAQAQRLYENLPDLELAERIA